MRAHTLTASDLTPLPRMPVCDAQGGTRAAAVAAVVMAVRGAGTVRAAYAEIRERRDVILEDEFLDELQPMAEAIAERFASNRRLLSQRGLLSAELGSILR